MSKSYGDLTRRNILSLLSWPMAHSFAQGMASRGVKAVPRGKPSGLPFRARFTDVGRKAGLLGTVVAGHTDHADYIVESMSCGAAFFDYDNDGWLDILVLSGSRFGDAPPNASNRLYKNNRNGTFTDVTEKAGLFRTGYANGVTVADYNNDGFDDLFITCWGQNILYRNNGDGAFTDVTKEAGLLDPEPRFGTGCVFFDYDRDGLLDLFVANYCGFDMDSVPRARGTGSCDYKNIPVFCGPKGLPYGRHSLYRNNGDGTFTDVTAASGIGKTEGGYGLTTAAADFDNDGWPDIYVACDSTPSLFFRNNHDGTFTEQGIERGIALNEDGMEQAGMGLAIGDPLLDGNLQIFKTHFSDDTPVLYVNDGKGNFRDATIGSGLGVETRYVGWGCGIADLDNDGLPDILCATGNVYPEVEKRLPGSPYKTPRVIFRNLGQGRFEELIGEAGPGIETPHASRGCAFGDFDNDGDLDILVINQNEPPSLLRNDLPGDQHWIKLKLRGVHSNRSAIGARATVRYAGRVQVQEAMSQSSYLSANDSRLHFGLGSATTADIEIRWPTGQVEKLPHVAADHLVLIVEGSGIVRWQSFHRAK
ncbi:MAG: CRTAC1 family protein [Acidobacteriota bacterium]|nr:CRTAC1 family protein [Acidobacteriota bacterium]